MSKKVLLVGHCGPDSSFLKVTIRKASPDAQILMADDLNELTRALAQQPDLALFNRELGYGFEESQGVEMIRALHRQHPGTKLMLVSNYEDAQKAALAAGAINGFGKRELGSPRVVKLIADALA